MGVVGEVGGGATLNWPTPNVTNHYIRPRPLVPHLLCRETIGRHFGFESFHELCPLTGLHTRTHVSLLAAVLCR